MTRHARSSSTTSTEEPRRSAGVGAIGLGGVNGKVILGQYIGANAYPRPQRRQIAL